MTDGKQGRGRIGVIQVNQAGSWRGMRKVLREDDSGWSWSRSVDMLEDAVTGCMVSASVRRRTVGAALIVVKDVERLYGAACHDGFMFCDCVPMWPGHDRSTSTWCLSFEEPIGVIELNAGLIFSRLGCIYEYARKSQFPSCSGLIPSRLGAFLSNAFKTRWSSFPALSKWPLQSHPLTA